LPVTVDDATALVLLDLQNDFLAPDGAYGRSGVASPELAALPARLASVVAAARSAKVPVISAQFTLLPVRGREPLVPTHLKERRPFLRKGDFEPGTRGHALVDELGPADVVIQKVAYSAFHASALEHALSGLHIRSLIIAGIVTNGGVASTVRDAHVRGYPSFLIGDGCADFNIKVHDLAIASLAAGVTQLTDCAEAQATFDAYRTR
jgi:ureidoacrylate peracid hydrolase